MSDIHIWYKASYHTSIPMTIRLHIQVIRNLSYRNCSSLLTGVVKMPSREQNRRAKQQEEYLKHRDNEFGTMLMLNKRGCLLVLRGGVMNRTQTRHELQISRRFRDLSSMANECLVQIIRKVTPELLFASM